MAANCHAPAVLTELKLSDGSNLVEGRKVTSMSNKKKLGIEFLMCRL